MTKEYYHEARWRKRKASNRDRCPEEAIEWSLEYTQEWGNRENCEEIQIAMSEIVLGFLEK